MQFHPPQWNTPADYTLSLDLCRSRALEIHQERHLDNDIVGDEVMAMIICAPTRLSGGSDANGW